MAWAETPQTDPLADLLMAVRAKYLSPTAFWWLFENAGSPVRVITVNIEILRALLVDRTPLDQADFCTIDSGLLERVMTAVFGTRFARLTGRHIVAASPDLLDARRVLVFGASELARKRTLARFADLGAAASDVATFGEPCDYSARTGPAGTARYVAFFAYGYPGQEQRIDQFTERYPDVPVLALGVGGAIDCFAGVVHDPPDILHRLGLEWVWRLVLQPHKRIHRILGIIPLAFRLKRMAGQAGRKGQFRGGHSLSQDAEG